MEIKNNVRNIALMITEKCNLDCYHCFRDVRENRLFNDSLTFLELADKFKSKAHEINFRITGGEPFLNKNVLKLIKIYSELGFCTSIGTNATLLNNNLIKQLKGVGLNNIWISVHSALPDLHDKLTGNEGSLKKTVDAINECARNGIQVNVNFPVSAYNIETAQETLEFLDSLNVGRIKILKITPLGKAGEENFKLLTAKDWTDLEHLVKGLNLKNPNIKIQGDPPLGSQEGKCTIYPLIHLNFDPEGYIYPCCLFNNNKSKAIGHVLDLLNGNLDEALSKMESRILEVYDLKNNPIPCFPNSEEKRICPLYSSNISNK